jgi:aminopeptidase N
MRSALVVAISLVLAAGLAPDAHALPATVDAAGPAAAVTTQLPRNVRPSHYAIEVTPDALKREFDGKVSITLDVLEPTAQIVLQAVDMQFSQSTLHDAAGKAIALVVSSDAPNQTATFAAAAPLAVGTYTLAMHYRGRIGTQANGLFLVDYPTDAGERRALFTQFENSDARRFVPSWDEPNYKATFDLTVNVPATQMAVSNMPVKQVGAIGNGLQQVVFDTTPKMSTYLLFLGVGEFERVARAGPGGTEIGVITQTGKVDQAAYALQASDEVLREFNDYFGVAYPLPKLDNIAAPGRSQFFSAMENWGAIFTFEHTLLLDPKVANVDDMQKIYSTAAHEIAHQWFGNLVTMAWWDDLWLNEGFATWMAARTTNALHPEWNTHGTDAAYSSRGAMGRDAYVTTHPVVQHVATVEQASQAFDAITYGKGGAVIGMLEDYVGADAWRDGVRRYIAAHAYGNAVTDQLWEQIDKAAPGKQFLQVAHDFTLQPGVPLIKVQASCVGGNTQVVLEQDEYTIDRPGKTALHWHVPVNLRSGDARAQVLVDGTARVQLAGCQAPVLVNAGQTGYYRTLYAPQQFSRLREGFSQLAAVDQLGVLLDTSALAAVGQQPEADLFDLISAVPAHASTDVWDVVAGTLGGIDELYRNDPRQADFRAFAIGRLSPQMQALGWDEREGDSAQAKQLRTRLIGTLSALGDASVKAEARRRFEAFLVEPESLSPQLRRSVLGVVARNADAATWDTLRELARKETASLIREQYFNLLAMPADPLLAQRALDMALTGEAGETAGAGLIATVSRTHPEMAFDFAVAHRERVDALVDSTSRARYYPGLAGSSSDLAMVAKVRKFATAHIAESSRRDAETAVGRIQTAVRLRDQRRPQIDAWLSTHTHTH